jgi:hypothetical protein
VVDSDTEALVICPISDSTKGKDIECDITKRCLLLGIKGRCVLGFRV